MFNDSFHVFKETVRDMNTQLFYILLLCAFILSFQIKLNDREWITQYESIQSIHNRRQWCGLICHCLPPACPPPPNPIKKVECLVKLKTRDPVLAINKCLITYKLLIITHVLGKINHLIMITSIIQVLLAANKSF